LLFVDCPNGHGHGHQVTHIKNVRIVKARNGHAKKILGRLRIRVFSCPGHPHEVVRFVGRI
jgi:hypothetical protein